MSADLVLVHGRCIRTAIETAGNWAAALPEADFEELRLKLEGNTGAAVRLLVASPALALISAARSREHPKPHLEDWLERSQSAVELRLRHPGQVSIYDAAEMDALVSAGTAIEFATSEVCDRTEVGGPKNSRVALAALLAKGLVHGLPNGPSVVDALKGLTTSYFVEPEDAWAVVTQSTLRELLDAKAGSKGFESEQGPAEVDRSAAENQRLAAELAVARETHERLRADLAACQSRLETYLLQATHSERELVELRSQLGDLEPALGHLRRELQSAKSNEAEWRRSAHAFAREADRLARDLASTTGAGRPERFEPAEKKGDPGLSDRMAGLLARAMRGR